jgi:hypothetical protein
MIAGTTLFMKIKFAIPMIALVLAAYMPAPDTTNPNPEITVIAVKMDAEWCGKCKVMNPKLQNVLPGFQDEPMLFVKFDFTDEYTRSQARKLATRLNLQEVFERHAPRTGFLVLVDAATGVELATLTSDLSEDDIRKNIGKWLIAKHE